MIDLFAADRLAQQQAQQMALMQAQQQQAAAQMTPEDTNSLVGSIYEGALGGLGYLGKVLDKTFGGRAIRGVLGGRPEELLSLIPFSDTLGITKDQNVVQGTDLLERAGLFSPGDNSWGHTLAGMATEMLLDPSTYLGIGPYTKAGQAAVKTGTATKGLAAGIRAGERGLVGFGLPFMAPAEGAIFGTTEAAARSLEGAQSLAGKALSVPLNLAEYAAKPAEWAMGVNPVTKAREAGVATGRYLNAMFNPEVQGATSSAGQQLGRDVYGPTLDRFRSPGQNLFGDLAVSIDDIGKAYGPEAQSAASRAIRMATEIPKDQTPFMKRIDEQFAQGISALDEKLANAQITQPQYQAAVDSLMSGRDYKMNALKMQREYLAANDPLELLKQHMPEAEAKTLLGKADDVQSFMDTLLDSERRQGIISGELDDVINYLPRQQNPLTRGKNEPVLDFLVRRNREGAGVADPTQIKRLDALRYLPGGTDQFEQLVKDTSLRSMSEADRAEAITQILSGTANPPAGSPVRQQAKELSKMMEGLDDRVGKDGVPFFSPDVAQMVKMKGEISARKMATTESIYSGVSQYSLTKQEIEASGKNGVKVADLLAQVGAETDPTKASVWKTISNKLGVPLKDVMNRYVPEDVAADMLRMGQAWKDPTVLAPVLQAWDSAMNLFKTSVTSVFPSFHVRNLMSGEFNKWRGGAQNLAANIDMQNVLRGGYLSDATAAKLYPGMSASEATTAFKKELLANEVAFTRQSRGTQEAIGSQAGLLPYSLPNTTGEVKTVGQVAKDTLGSLLPQQSLKNEGYNTFRQYLDPFATEGVAADKNVNRLVDTGRMIGNQVEDYLRGSHYMAKRLEGFTAQAAAEEVAKYQIDYGNATNFEKKVMKRLMPWYGFSRGNLPPILEDLASQPAKVAQTVRAVTGTRDPDQFTPQYIAEGASFPLGSPQEGTNRYISSFGLPVEDELVKTIGSAVSGDYRRVFQQAFGMLNPYVKVPAELATDTQMFSGRRLSDLQPSPVATLGGILPNQAGLLATELVANSPASRVVSSVDRLMDSRKGLVPTVLNALTGVKISDVDVERAKLSAYRQTIQDVLRPLPESRVREEVYVPADQRAGLSPQAESLLQAQKILNQQILDLNKKRRGE